MALRGHAARYKPELERNGTAHARQSPLCRESLSDMQMPSPEPCTGVSRKLGRFIARLDIETRDPVLDNSRFMAEIAADYGSKPWMFKL